LKACCLVVKSSLIHVTLHLGFFVVSLRKTNPNPMELIALTDLPIEDQLNVEFNIYQTFKKLRTGEHGVFGIELNPGGQYLCATVIKIDEGHHQSLFMVTNQLNAFLDMINEMQDDKQTVAEIIGALRNQGV
jgi:hypothetical protein